jgi:hypothetical protein
MAIHLFCYVTTSIEMTNEIIKLVSFAHHDLFQSRFLISAPTIVGDHEKEIALEHNCSAQSIFLVRLNDKSAADLLLDVSEKLKEAFGPTNILILHNNDNIF